jgi:hypothetical protein
MRVLLKGEYEALKRNLIMEGDEVVDDYADLVLSPYYDDYQSSSVKVVGGNFRFPDVVVEAMGYVMQDEPEALIAFRWFDEEWWRDQIIVGFPLEFFMDGGLSIRQDTGMACRFVDSPSLRNLFENETLENTLRESRHCGFVTIGLTADLLVKSIQTGVPNRGFFNALEGVQGKITDYIIGKESRLLESWTTNLLLTRYPFPFKQVSERVFIRNLTQDIEKHFWLFHGVGHRKSLYTDSTSIGVATSWSPTLSEACRRSIRTLRNIDIPNKQFRMDLVRVAGERWGAVKDYLGE